jgi:hypothetical protein
LVDLRLQHDVEQRVATHAHGWCPHDDDDHDRVRDHDDHDRVRDHDDHDRARDHDDNDRARDHDDASIGSIG